MHAGFAQNDRELRRKTEKDAAATVDDAGSDSDSEGEEARKLYNRMEAKLRRFCTPKASGKCDADKALLAQWREKGHSRTQLVKLMMEADGDRELQCLMLCSMHISQYRVDL